MTKVSEYISYYEATYSATAVRLGIENTPNELQFAAMQNIGKNIFDPVRIWAGLPIGVSSFFRSIPLNAAINGSKRSQHCKGEAIDIDADIYGDITNREIFDFIRDRFIFDQLIWEFGDEKNPAWVHVSLKLYGENRSQILRAYKDDNNKTRYQYWN